MYARRIVVFSGVLSGMALAFSFSVEGTPSECDDFSVSWIDGTAPFQLLLTPVFGTPRKLSIPSSAMQDGKGSYTTQLTFPANKKFVATMSDAKGFGTGGTTTMYTTSSSTGGTCNTTDPGVDFSFQLNTALQQCRPYTFSGYDGAVQPVTITGIIPGGESFVLHPSEGATSYDWVANVYNETSLIFVMEDAEGRTGGSSDVRTVSSSDDASCIDDSSPSSTILPTSTGSAPASTSGTESGSSGTSIGAIAGTVLGALVFLAVFITLGLFFLRRRRDQRNNRSRYSRRLQSDVDLTDDPFRPAGNSFTHADTTHVAYSDDGMSGSTSIHRSQAPAEHGFEGSSVQGTEINPFTAQSPTELSMSTAQRKAAMAGSSAYMPSRFIVHTDLEDAGVTPNDEGVVELPPQYSERPGPSSDMALRANSSKSPQPPPTDVPS